MSGLLGSNIIVPAECKINMHHFSNFLNVAAATFLVLLAIFSELLHYYRDSPKANLW